MRSLARIALCTTILMVGGTVIGQPPMLYDSIGGLRFKGQDLVVTTTGNQFASFHCNAGTIEVDSVSTFTFPPFDHLPVVSATAECKQGVCFAWIIAYDRRSVKVGAFPRGTTVHVTAIAP